MRHCPAPPDAAPLEQPPGDASDPGEAGVPSLDEATRVVKGFMDRLTADQQADKALCMDRGQCAWEEPMSLRRLLDCGFSLKKYRQTRQAARQAASLRFQTACRVLAEEHPFLLVRNMAYKLLARIPAQDVRSGKALRSAARDLQAALSVSEVPEAGGAAERRAAPVPDAVGVPL
ncbi:hypothetical protein ACWKW4_12315 [Hydrogenophaga borbori]